MISASDVARLRGGLSGLGLEPGDRVAIICGNNGYFVGAYLAVIGGMIAVPLNPMSPPVELAGQLTTAECRAVIIGPTARTLFDTIDRDSIPTIEFFIGCGFDPEGGMSHETLMEVEPADIVERDDDDVAAFIFTSGTAGAPKAAMLTHGNLRQHRSGAVDAGSTQNADDVVFAILPMFHIFGLNVVLGVTLAVGGPPPADRTVRPPSRRSGSHPQARRHGRDRSADDVGGLGLVFPMWPKCSRFPKRRRSRRSGWRCRAQRAFPRTLPARCRLGTECT